MPITWSDTNRYRLLLAIIDTMLETQSVKMPDWSTVAGKMPESCTAEAVRQQFKNIKKNAKSQLAEGGAPGLATPRGRKRAANKDAEDGKLVTPKGRKSAAMNAEKGMADDDEVTSPTKKQKKMDSKERAGSVEVVKEEPEDTEVV